MKLKDLLAILRGEEPTQELGQEFAEMLRLIEGMFRDTNAALWDGDLHVELKDDIRRRDIELNKLERASRRRVLNHLALGDVDSVPFCFVLVNVVKDAERIGDYVKNLAELKVITGVSLPEGEIKTALQEISSAIEEQLGKVGDVFQASDRAEAETRIRSGRALAKRTDELVQKIAAAGYSSQVTVAMVLTCRFYKRIIAHTVNILSSVIMPLHKIDFFDEEEIPHVTGK